MTSSCLQKGCNISILLVCLVCLLPRECVVLLSNIHHTTTITPTLNVRFIASRAAPAIATTGTTVRVALNLLQAIKLL